MTLSPRAGEIRLFFLPTAISPSCLPRRGNRDNIEMGPGKLDVCLGATSLSSSPLQRSDRAQHCRKPLQRFELGSEDSKSAHEIPKLVKMFQKQPEYSKSAWKIENRHEFISEAPGKLRSDMNSARKGSKNRDWRKNRFESHHRILMIQEGLALRISSSRAEPRRPCVAS